MKYVCIEKPRLKGTWSRFVFFFINFIEALEELIELITFGAIELSISMEILMKYMSRDND